MEHLNWTSVVVIGEAVHRRSEKVPRAHELVQLPSTSLGSAESATPADFRGALPFALVARGDEQWGNQEPPTPKRDQQPLLRLELSFCADQVGADHAVQFDTGYRSEAATVGRLSHTPPDRAALPSLAGPTDRLEGLPCLMIQTARGALHGLMYC